MLRRRNSLPPTSRFHHFETLEPRQMMDGGLTASLTNGTLFINEAPGSLGLDQGVQVLQLASGRVRVTGLEAPGGGATSVNGNTSAEFSHPTNIVIGMGGGQDLVQVLNTNVNNIQLITQDFGNGANDHDIVHLANVKTTGVLDIRTGVGIDRVTVQNSVIGDHVGADDLKITTGVAAAAGQSDQDIGHPERRHHAKRDAHQHRRQQ